MYGALSLWAMAAAYPLVWMLITALKKDAELYRSPFALPEKLRWSNFVNAWVQGHLAPCVVNSIEVTLASLVLGLGLSVACAFAFARLNFGPLKSFFWTYVMFGFLVPDSVRFFPLMVFFAKIGLFDSIWALVLIYSAGGIPWNTFFLRAFMERIPRDYEDAAVVDGASIWQVFRHVIVPLSRAARDACDVPRARGLERVCHGVLLDELGKRAHAAGRNPDAHRRARHQLDRHRRRACDRHDPDCRVLRAPAEAHREGPDGRFARRITVGAKDSDNGAIIFSRGLPSESFAPTRTDRPE